jgi:hypothetical protein
MMRGGMNGKRPPSSRSVEKQSERERSAGLDPADEAAQWLGENDAKPEPQRSKSAGKSKALHRWRQQQGK